MGEAVGETQAQSDEDSTVRDTGQLIKGGDTSLVSRIGRVGRLAGPSL